MPVDFKDVHSLVTRIMYNKKKRETNEEIVYTRFVLSSVKSKRLSDKEDKTKKTQKAEDEENEMADVQGGEDGDYPVPPSSDGGDEKKKQEPQNKVGYVSVIQLYVQFLVHYGEYLQIQVQEGPLRH